MEMILSAEEQELLIRVLEHRHRELLREIAHTDYREFKQALLKDEKLLDAMVGRLRGSAVSGTRS